MVRQLHLGGCERDLTRLALGMDRSRYEPHVVCFDSKGLRGEELRAAGVPILELPVRSYKDRSVWKGAKRMRRYIREHGVRVLQALDAPAVIFGVPVAKLAGVDAVIPCTLGHRELYGESVARLLRIGDFLGDQLIVNCQALIEHLVERGLARRDRTSRVYNGIDVESFRPPDSPQTRRAVLPPQIANADFVVGTICALRPEKDVETLIAGFAAFGQSRPGARLVVVGSGPELPKLEQAAERLKISERTHFEPFTADVKAWLHAMDVFVLSSTSESFPNGLLEAMACGTAAIATSVGGVPEMAADGERALLFAPGDSAGLSARLLRMAEQPELRRKLAGAARDFVARELTVERFVRETQQVYDLVLARKAAARGG